MFLALVSPSHPRFIVPFLPDPYSALATQPAHPQVDFQKSPSSDLVARLAASRPKKPTPLAKKLVRPICSKSYLQDFSRAGSRYPNGRFSARAQILLRLNQGRVFGKLYIYLQSDVLPILYFRRYKGLTQFL